MDITGLVYLTLSRFLASNLGKRAIWDIGCDAVRRALWAEPTREEKASVAKCVEPVLLNPIA